MMTVKTAFDVIEITRPSNELYLCSRTSSWEGKPCAEAFEVIIISTDTRSCDDPKKIPANRGTDGDWYERGTNHRVENGKIKRDIGTIKKWAVLIKNIVDFIDAQGQCIIDRNTDGFLTIEIYDDYRE